MHMPPGQPPPLPESPLAIAKRAEARVQGFEARLVKAEDKAHAAANHAASTYQSVTGLTARFDTFEGKVLGAVGRIERRLNSRASQHDVQEIRGDIEDTKTRILVSDIKKTKASLKYHRWILGTLAVGSLLEVVRVIVERIAK